MSKVRLGDIAREHKETCKGDKSAYPIVGLEHLDPGCITLAKWSNSAENTFSKVFRKNHVLFGRRRAYLKKAALAPFDGICSGDITVIEAIPSRIVPELLPFIIQNDSLFDFAVARSAGSLSPRVKWTHLKDYEFDLPDGIENQRKLAELLWSFEHTRQSYLVLLRATDALVKSQFIEMFGDPVRNTKKWKEVPLSQCLHSIDSGKSFSCQAFSRKNEWPAVLKLSAVTSGNYIPEENKALIKKRQFVDSATVHKGDLLFARKNTPELVGMSAFVYKTPPSLMLPDTIFNLNTNGTCHKIFLWKLINLNIFRSKICGIASGTAKSMSNISKERLFDLTIIRPPVELQLAFATFVQQLDKSKYAVEKEVIYQASA